MVRRSLSAAVILTLGLVAPAAAFARSYMTPGFRTMKSRPMTIAVLPPHAEFIRSKVVATGEMVAESAALEREAGVALRTNLEVLGYKVRLLTPEEIGRDARLRELVVKVDSRFTGEWGRMVYRPHAVKQERYTAGEDAVRLAALLDVDGLAVARVIAVAQMKGTATVTSSTNTNDSPQRAYGRIDVGILNGKLGRVEGFFTGVEPTSLARLTEKPAKVMGRAAESALSRYPASGVAGAVEDIPLPASETNRKGHGAPPDDVAAIRDFEMLIKGAGVPGGAKNAPKPAGSNQAALSRPALSSNAGQSP